MFALALAFLVSTDSSCGVRSSDWLSLLPDGEEKRTFILDCTGCHQLDAQRALTGGRPKTEAEWSAAAARMLGYAGATSSFPVISHQRDAARTAAWLARHLTAAPPRRCSAGLPAGAVVTEYRMPQENDLPHDVAVDSAGSVIVTGMFTHKLYALNQRDGSWRDIEIPVPRSNPRALELDAAGAYWVVLGAPNKLARYLPASGEWTTWDVGVYAHSVAPDARGRAWYNGHFTRAPELIGFVDSSAEGATPVTVPPHPTLANVPGGPIPYEIRAAPDGRIWTGELGGNRIVAYDPAANRFESFTLPVTHSGPRRFDIDRDGVLWIPAYAGNALWRFDPRTRQFESFELPVRDALPYVVRIDHATRRVWIGTGAADALIAFDPAPRRFTVYPLPSEGALVRHLAIDPRTHDVWAAYGASPGIPARIARLQPGGGGGQGAAPSDSVPAWRESLRQRERATASRMRRLGYAGAVADVMAADAPILVEGAPVTVGVDAVRVLGAQRALSRARIDRLPVSIVVSPDGSLGITHGVTVIGATGRDTAGARFSKYISVWRREAGTWMLAAHVETALLGASATTPAGLAGTRAPGVEGPAAPFAAADRAFSRMAGDSGAPAAFAAFAAPTAAFFPATGETLNGAAAIRARMAESRARSHWAWEPVAGGASADGSLGWTVGEATITVTPAEGEPRAFKSKYLTAWQRMPDGSIRYIADAGNERP